ncbi:MAG TPA: o-succinylbenzoate synthase [Acidobacteriota bacterium]|nr:o-succinylbenzoate synthase [Acidobacteriota bacterium]
MKIIEARLFEYSLPLRAPLPVGQYRLKTREGLLAALRNEMGEVGWGDIAPLPGFSREDISQAVRASADLLAGIMSTDASGLAGLARQSPPSVAFGIESALISLNALRPWPGEARAEIVPVNGLLSGSLQEVESQTSRLMDEGYRALKLKVGRDSIEEDLKKVAAVRSLADRSVKLRLDANQAWEFDDAVEFGRSVREYEIEHIEEPLRDNTRLEEFHRGSGVSYALDESLRKIEPANVSALEGLTALVIKPTLLGGMTRSLRFVQRAGELSIVPVISSSFESSVGLLALAGMAAAVAPDIACGLGVASWFAEDLLRFPIAITRGNMRAVQSRLHDGHIRMDLLREVAFRL